jgi:diguanylate cyclase (GGDEF)-like protein
LDEPKRMEAYSLIRHDRSDYDDVTGLPTKQYFDQLLADTWRNLDGTMFSLIALDIQGFSLFVKNYGQQTADECLRRLTTAAEKVLCRSGWRLARYGIDRFLIMLSGATKEEADAIAQDLDIQISALELALNIRTRIATTLAYETPSTDHLLARVIENSISAKS